ncbi:hypothetical protein Ddye_008245 [Dipteronia dyeriana]|uniref:tRNA nucleotidyltransferase/poly(A) polymerase RNA and SrmB- binding domain-containing protein n=1 Tax=Dipteronia dyeriana TaxID=168575 RepID=A0AAD9X9Z5_9ROSI|nr:hypothetical protein Ddye_008245 [Dipteronia dyeriana]
MDPLQNMVSSFETVAKEDEGTQKVYLFQKPYGCDEEDLVLWRNIMHLDFTINRMLRGLIIAARHGLSLTKDTETAIRKLSPSIEKLDQFRLILELNYMLSYGVAEPSICLLHKLNLLELNYILS